MLPTVIVPIRGALAALDACLAALDRSLDAGAVVLLADDASGDPRAAGLLSGWCAGTRLAARHLRGERPRGLPAACNAAFAEAGESDVVLLAPDVLPAGEWLSAFAAAARDAGDVASLSAWSNDGEICGFPQFCEPSPPPADPAELQRAAVAGRTRVPAQLPAAAGPAVLLRREALRRFGDFDAVTFRHLEQALADWCRRADAMGWRHLLCESVFVARRSAESAPVTPDQAEDLARLLARWPDQHERMARFILEDPLRSARRALQESLDELARTGPQGDLFGRSSP
ncbi:glycosyltransferase family 2 protein [Arenimonas fontis]|uniref:Glycosyltransferase n=1 Tax=Arenimonas fontis TaxID=2608255 RepID=A0A5B2ZAJ4_9GAMM|nr:glycosyltransferase [Arenimonas fontis]KAA2284977.1 glycosyltransferase [Arenimonas fontis]